MNIDKRAIALLIFTLAVVGGYLPYRLGYWTPDTVPARAVNVASGAILGENSIDNVRITGHTDHTITAAMDVHYNGEYGPQSAVQIALITSKHGHDYVYSKGILPVRRGDTSSEVIIHRPMYVRDELTFNKVRLAFYKDRIWIDDDPDVFKVVEVNYTLPSMISEREKLSPEFWKSRVVELFNGREYDALDRLVEDWNSPEVRDIDGKWSLEAINAINSEHATRNQWDSHLEIIRKGRERFPDSASFALIEAGFWIKYAWDARGTGYADSVTEAGWQLFRERLDRAEQVLLESKDYASNNPVWYQHYITVAMASGWSKEKILALFAEAIGRHPSYYQLYFSAVYALSPKWGGSMELMDLVARAADEILPEPERDVVYARVYWSISVNLRENESLFDDSLVSWPRMKAGFRQLLDDYPDSIWNLNNFGRFACSAGDDTAYREVRARIGTERIVQDVWKGNTSLEACDRTLLASN